MQRLILHLLSLRLSLVLPGYRALFCSNYPNTYQFTSRVEKLLGRSQLRIVTNICILRRTNHVGDQVLRVGGHAEDVGKTFETLALDEKVPVYFDPASPEAAILGDPLEHVKSGLRGTFIILFIPTILFVFFQLSRRRTASRPPMTTTTTTS
jgi:hypothetical protein